MRWTRGCAVAVLLVAAWAQSPPEIPAGPPVLENSGKPMRPAFECTAEDIHAAGLSCSEDEPCPIYLELSALESVGNQIFAAGNIHASAATLSSIFLASSDNGKTWREPYQRIAGAGIDRILFIDFEHGWAAGQTVQPLARDPFLLITADGGKAWRRQALFDDTRAGSIQQIWFDSKNTGSLIFDRGQSSDGPRFELYESATGGDNWMVREASDQAMRIKRMPAESGHPDWRLRADAATKAYRIEKQQGTRWTPIASFAVEIGACKPPKAVEQEPPPEPVTEQTAPKPVDRGTLSLPALRGEPPRKK